MATKKSTFVLSGILVISAWVLGSAIQAGADDIFEALIKAKGKMDLQATTETPLDVVWEAAQDAVQELGIVVGGKKFSENKGEIGGHIGQLDYIRVYVWQLVPGSTKIGIQARTAMLPRTRTGYDHAYATKIMNTINGKLPQREASFPGFREVSKSEKCPPADSEAPFAKLMNPGFSDDYIGCDVRTTVQFFASGAGNYVLPISLKDKVVFRCLPPGATGEKNPLSGTIDANFVVIPKSISNLVFELKPGDLMELRGGNHVSSATIGGSYKQIVFVATSIQRVQR